MPKLEITTTSTAVLTVYPDVAARLDAQHLGIDGKVDADQSQIEAVKALIIARINALPEKFNACSIRADGRILGTVENIRIMVVGANILT